MAETYKRRNWEITFVLGVGVLLRLVLGIYNPPNNTYDDYLEPIAFYINNDHRPSPEVCWECYQPPLYFYLTAEVYKASFLAFNSYFLSWKFVQFLNVLLSIGTLFIIFRILLKLFPNDRNILLIVLAVISIYPRDIYTSAMITNDPLVVFLVTLSVLFFINYWHQKSHLSLFLLCASVLGTAFTKQHGLISMIFLGAVVVYFIYQNRGNLIQSLWSIHVILPLLTILLCFGDEIWKYTMTQQLLVSNQHFFDYASTQLPGSLDKVEFYSFDYFTLLDNPFLDASTVYSYWTVLFASAWFDYEWRYTSPHLPAVKMVATMMYTLGAIVVVTWLIGISQAIRKLKTVKFDVLILIVAGICFLFVPLLQTFRFPYYSSMKSLFFLPALSIIAITLVYGFRQIDFLNKRGVMYIVVGVTLLVGVTNITYTLFYLDTALPELSGPLWKFPNIALP